MYRKIFLNIFSMLSFFLEDAVFVRICPFFWRQNREFRFLKLPLGGKQCMIAL